MTRGCRRAGGHGCVWGWGTWGSLPAEWAGPPALRREEGTPGQLSLRVGGIASAPPPPFLKGPEESVTVLCPSSYHGRMRHPRSCAGTLEPFLLVAWLQDHLSRVPQKGLGSGATGRGVGRVAAVGNAVSTFDHI